MVHSSWLITAFVSGALSSDTYAPKSGIPDEEVSLLQVQGLDNQQLGTWQPKNCCIDCEAEYPRQKHSKKLKQCQKMQRRPKCASVNCPFEQLDENNVNVEDPEDEAEDLDEVDDLEAEEDLDGDEDEAEDLDEDEAEIVEDLDGDTVDDLIDERLRWWAPEMCCIDCEAEYPRQKHSKKLKLCKRRQRRQRCASVTCPSEDPDEENTAEDPVEENTGTPEEVSLPQVQRLDNHPDGTWKPELCCLDCEAAYPRQKHSKKLKQCKRKQRRSKCKYLRGNCPFEDPCPSDCPGNCQCKGEFPQPSPFLDAAVCSKKCGRLCIRDTLGKLHCPQAKPLPMPLPDHSDLQLVEAHSVCKCNKEVLPEQQACTKETKCPLPCTALGNGWRCPLQGPVLGRR